jgi:hypothetical protein
MPVLSYPHHFFRSISCDKLSKLRLCQARLL